MKRALVLVGASGVGKTTVAEKVLSLSDKFVLVRSATTRPRRGDGKDEEYVYLTEGEFRSRIDNGEMLEYTVYSGNYYGTPLSELESIFSQGKTPLMILDLNGAKSLSNKSVLFDPVIVYLYETLDVIKRRLENRAGSSSADVVISRMEQNLRDFLELPIICDIFSAFVKNTDLSVSANSVINLLSHKAKDNSENEKTAKMLALSAEKFIIA